MSTRFVWDADKSNQNRRKHRVSFEVIRIISARRTDKTERRRYEDAQR